MSLPLGDLASRIGGTLHGDAAVVIHGADIIRDAAPGQITFADSHEAAASLADSPAAAVIVSNHLPSLSMPQVVVADVRAAFRGVVEHFRPPVHYGRIGIDPQAYVSPSAKIADGADVHPLAYVGDNVTIGSGSVIHSGVRILPGCVIGEHTTLFPNVVLYENTHVGNRCLIHAGVVLGAYGFGYETVAGKHQKCAQLGNVVIEDEVEIGAVSTVDRGSYGSTVIGSGTKIDNMVMVGHNGKIGRHNLLCSQVGIAGSCSTGDYVVMAGQVGLNDHIHIGDGAVLGGKAGVHYDVPPKSRMLGYPAVRDRDFAALINNQSKLPEMRKQLKRLMRQVAALEAALGEDRPEADAA